VRYVNVDHGNHYSVLTDDADALRIGMDEESFNKWRAKDGEDLRRYDVLFSALASLIFLPSVFLEETEHIADVEFKTTCFSSQSEKHVKTAIKELGTGCCVNSALVRCLARAVPRGLEDAREIKPPDMEFQSEGYWRKLSPGTIGQDKDGNPIVGRSWVTRTEC
jgi:hypothetical protein